MNSLHFHKSVITVFPSKKGLLTAHKSVLPFCIPILVRYQFARYLRVMSVLIITWCGFSSFQNSKRYSNFGLCSEEVNCFTNKRCVIQVIDYCTLLMESPIADGRRELIRNMWNERIKGTKRNVEVI